MSTFYKNHGKRIFDLCCIIPCLIFIIPLLFLLGMLVYIKHGSPILFRQTRPGLNCKPFTIYKFRTMKDIRDSNGNLLSDKERLTPLGRFLRSCSLDEFPELFNVIKGDMSLVGPRPLLMKYIPFFTEHEFIRFSARPGITGLSQIMGRNFLCWDLRIAKDVEYVEKLNIFLDIWILILTIYQVFFRKGIHTDPRTIMPDFDDERRQRQI